MADYERRQLLLQEDSEPPPPNDSLRTQVQEELWQFVVVAVPTLVSNVCEYLPLTFLLSFVGRSTSSVKQYGQTKLQLDAASLGGAFFNLSGLSLGYGCISALRTLVPQAVGANQTKQCGLYMQRAVVVSVIVFVVVALLQIFSDKLLILLQQPPQLALMANRFTIRMLPAYFGFVWFAIVQRLLQAKSMTLVMVLSTLVMAGVSPLILWLFVDQLALGYVGGPYAVSCYIFIPLLVILVFLRKKEDMAFVFESHSLREVFDPKGMRDFLALSIPGLFQLCLDWWALEAISLVAGALPNPTVMIGASYIVLNLSTLAGMAWLSILIFNSVRVGYHVGARDVLKARRAAVIGSIMGGIIVLPLVVLVLVFREKIPTLYTDDLDIQAVASEVLVVFAFVVVADCLNSCTSGVMCGLGLQKYSAWCQFVAFYVIGLPFGITMALKAASSQHPSVWWLWVGIGCGLTVSCLGQFMFLLKVDWHAAVLAAQDRLEGDIQSSDEYIISSDPT